MTHHKILTRLIPSGFSLAGEEKGRRKGGILLKIGQSLILIFGVLGLSACSLRI